MVRGSQVLQDVQLLRGVEAVRFANSYNLNPDNTWRTDTELIIECIKDENISDILKRRVKEVLQMHGMGNIPTVFRVIFDPPV